MIRTFLEKRRVRRAFEKLVDAEHVESLLRNDVEAKPLRRGHIEFVLAFVRDEDPSRISDRIARVSEVSRTHGAMVHDLVGALVIVAFGTHPTSSSEAGRRSALVQALREQLAGDIKIVHGAADGHYGILGSETRMSYTFLVPQFDRALGELSRLKFGETEEFG